MTLKRQGLPCSLEDITPPADALALLHRDDAVLSTVKVTADPDRREQRGTITIHSNDPDTPSWTLDVVAGQKPLASGDTAPDFTLQLLGKKAKVTLSEQCKEKPVVLTFGSYTCPPFRRALEGMEDVYKAHKEDCNFLFVYVKEAHASDGWVSGGNVAQGIEIKQHKTYEERSGAAKTCQGKLEISMPILIDSLDDATAKQYGGVPNRAYLIAKGGKVIYKGDRGPMGTRPDQVKAAIEELLAE